MWRPCHSVSTASKRTNKEGNDIHQGEGEARGGGNGWGGFSNENSYEPGSSFTGHVCDDHEASCLQLAKEGACDAYPTWMLLTCRKSCGNCGCEDLAANCSLLAKEEKCLHDDHVNWMLRNCQRSCKVCLGKITKTQASISELGLSTIRGTFWVIVD